MHLLCRVSADSLKAWAERVARVIEVIRHTHRLSLVQSADQADAVLEGKGGLWIRGYRSLSPRARVDPSSAEPVYAGYLSIKVQGKDGETLWSYFANPKRVSFGDLKHDLAAQLVGKLVEDISNSVDSTVATASPSGTASCGGGPFIWPARAASFPSSRARSEQLARRFCGIPEGRFHASVRHPAWQFQYEPVGSEAGLEQLAGSGNSRRF